MNILMRILPDLSDDNKHVKQLSNAQIAKIRDISNGNSEVKYTAIGLLAFLEDKTYPDVIERRRNAFGNGENTNSFIVRAQSTASTTMQLTPNPTQAMLNIKLPNMELSDDTKLTVTDMFGRMLKTVQLGQVSQYVLSVDNLPNGIYFCTLQSNQKVIEVQKFSILK
jgi:hypothetical protein